ncbi:MAG: DUF2336 domain-containing protein [Alphaproteobacteria bacterium]|nr:MAG: DUF2336 domain-containing protein [Alphaproteobacteria bacterium]
MIVRHFLQWVRTAEAAERAEATSALARAYLYSDLSHDDRIAAEGAMIMLLDDPSPLVRHALADALGSSRDAPATVVHALINDQPGIAMIVLERSPLLLDSDLVDALAVGSAEVQAAIARRETLPRSVSAAIAEVGAAEACLTLIENPGAEIAAFSLDRVVERFGHLAAVRETLLAWPDLPAAIRQVLVVKLSETLAGFVVARNWMEEGRAQRVAQEACEKATVILAAHSESAEVSALIGHLRETGQLTTGLVLRSLLSGNLDFFEQSLAELTGLPPARVGALLHDRRGAGFKAVFDRAGLSSSVYPAFRGAIEAMHEIGLQAEPGGNTRLRRRMVERVLTSCAGMPAGEVEPLMTLLRRYATEAAREEARMFCDELVEMGNMSNIVPANDTRRVVAA